MYVYKEPSSPTEHQKGKREMRGEREGEKESRRTKDGFSNPNILKVTKEQYLGWNR